MGKQRERKLVLINHHKVGSALVWKIFEPLCLRQNWNIEQIHGIAESMPQNADVIQLMHGIATSDFIGSDFRGIRFIRDPRDVIVSGFLYHKRCDEKWCKNNLFETENLMHPRVPWPIQHLEEEKIMWIERLGGKSYQRNLLGMDDTDGLIFEMRGYAKITIESMLRWKDDPRILCVRIEDLATDFDGVVRSMLEWAGIEGEEALRELRLAQKHDISRMSAGEISSDRHISSPKITKWKSYFDDDVLAEYNELFGGAHSELGYD
tara:strand:- start:762 stop:1553 length:792 start_codon:yes stop_codon:yes gene_type:complete